MNERHPYSYQIVLRGKLDHEQASWFPELSHAVNEDGDTQLLGKLPDQSALIGILFRAHNLNLRILSVTVKQIKTLSEEPNGTVQNT